MMHPERFSSEQQEQKEFELAITVYRHGPKEGKDGATTDEGKLWIAERTRHDYEGITLNNNLSIRRRVLSSSKPRTQETAQIYQNTLKNYNDQEPIPLEVEERLSEGDVMQFINRLPDNTNDWFRHWYTASERPVEDIKIGRDALHGFSEWLLETINKVSEQGGEEEIEAFSHGPLMAAFVLKIEELTGETIISEGQDEYSRLDRDKLMDGNFHFMSTLNLQISSKNPDIVRLICQGKTVDIPISVIEALRTI